MTDDERRFAERAALIADRIDTICAGEGCRVVEVALTVYLVNLIRVWPYDKIELLDRIVKDLKRAVLKQDV